MSDTYYIRAYHNKRHINIPLEEKHKYHISLGGISMVNKLSSDNTTGQGYQIDYHNCDILQSSNHFRLEQGDDEQERIGDKVQIRNVAMTLAIYWRTAFLKKWFNTGDDQYFDGMTNSTPANSLPGFVNLRLMCVQFDKPLNGDTGNPFNAATNPSVETTMRQDFVKWFINTYIYYDLETGTGGTTYVHQSIHQNKLRESTPYTGTFKILYDKKLKLKTNKDIQLEYVLPIKKNVNILDDNTITSDTVKNIYWVLLGPAFYDVDVSPNIRAVLSNAFDGGSAEIFTNFASTEANFKLSYYDL